MWFNLPNCQLMEEKQVQIVFIWIHLDSDGFVGCFSLKSDPVNFDLILGFNSLIKIHSNRPRVGIESSKYGKIRLRIDGKTKWTKNILPRMTIAKAKEGSPVVKHQLIWKRLGIAKNWSNLIKMCDKQDARDWHQCQCCFSSANCVNYYSYLPQ